ncbi:protein kinase [Myxococcota bacterium]
MVNLTGRIVGKYRLERLIGKGGMGVVYQARHTLVGKRCALKMLHPRHAGNDEAVQRMLREAQAAAAIGHPNIVVTHDFGAAEGGGYYLVMDLLEGESLADRIKRLGRIEVQPLVGIVIQVLSALEAAHAKGIVHRDLKPENIFLALQRSGGEEVRLLDFGVSKFTPGGPDELRLTRTGAVLGTPYYMSPEQASGARDVDGRTDLWSLGVIFFEGLTGRQPFTGHNYNRLMFNIMTQATPVLRSERLDVPAALEAVIRQALEKEPDQRFSTAAEMAEALRPFGEPTPANADERPAAAPRPGPAQRAEAAEAAESTQVENVHWASADSGIETHQMRLPQSRPRVGTQASPVEGFPSGPSPQGDPRIEGGSITLSTAEVVSRRDSALGTGWRGWPRRRLAALGGAIGGMVVLLIVVLAGSLRSGGQGGGSKPDASEQWTGRGRMDGALSAELAAGSEPVVQPLPGKDARPGSVIEPPIAPGTQARTPTEASMERTKEAPIEAPARMLTVSVPGLPRGAMLRLDGGHRTRPPFHCTADGKRHKLEVTAPGYHPEVTHFTASADLTSIKIEMRRRAARILRPRPMPARPMTTRSGVFTDPYSMQ